MLNDLTTWCLRGIWNHLLLCWHFHRLVVQQQAYGSSKKNVSKLLKCRSLSLNEAQSKHFMRLGHMLPFNASFTRITLPLHPGPTVTEDNPFNEVPYSDHRDLTPEFIRCTLSDPSTGSKFDLEQRSGGEGWAVMGMSLKRTKAGLRYWSEVRSVSLQRAEGIREQQDLLSKQVFISLGLMFA